MADQLNIKIDSALKKQAEALAKKLGVSLSAVLRGYLTQFVQTKTLHLSVADASDTPPGLTGVQLASILMEDGWSKSTAEEFGKDYDEMLQNETDGTLIECS